MRAIVAGSRWDVQTASVSHRVRVAMSRAASSLAPKAVGNSRSQSGAGLEHPGVVKVFVHLKAAHWVGRCTVVAVRKAGWGIGLAGGSSSRSAARVEIRNLAAQGGLNHVLTSLAANHPSSLDRRVVANTVAKAPGTSSGRCISLRKMACVAVTVAPSLRLVKVHALFRPFNGVSRRRMARRRWIMSAAVKVLRVIGACDVGGRCDPLRAARATGPLFLCL